MLTTFQQLSKLAEIPKHRSGNAFHGEGAFRYLQRRRMCTPYIPLSKASDFRLLPFQGFSGLNLPSSLESANLVVCRPCTARKKRLPEGSYIPTGNAEM